MDAFDNLSNLLTEMQLELIRRDWSEDVYERITQATDFRGKLYDAICAFRDAYPSLKVPS